jgi:hypothetical protein
MKKSLNEMVWPVEKYTDKVYDELGVMFTKYGWLSFTKDQIADHMKRELPWLGSNTENQNVLLNRLISTGIKKLVQLGVVVEVTSNVSVDLQWKHAEGVENSGYASVTDPKSVAKTEDAKKAISRRAIGTKKLRKLNEIKE